MVRNHEVSQYSVARWGLAEAIEYRMCAKPCVFYSILSPGGVLQARADNALVRAAQLAGRLPTPLPSGPPPPVGADALLAPAGADASRGPGLNQGCRPAWPTWSRASALRPWRQIS